MKKYFFFLIFGLVLSLSTPAFALDPIDGPKSVNGFGSTTEQTVFELSEIPFIYTAFDRDDVNTSASLFTNWVWRNPSNAVVSVTFDSISDFPLDPVETWNSVSNWNNVKQIGEWQVSTTWFNEIDGVKGGFGSQNVSFTVTPEPVSSLLFIIGGLPIAFGIFKRNKDLN